MAKSAGRASAVLTFEPHPRAYFVPDRPMFRLTSEATKLAVLARHCADEGRDPAEIDKTISTRIMPGETTSEIAERLDGFATLGIDHAVFITQGAWQPATLAVLTAAASRIASQ